MLSKLKVRRHNKQHQQSKINMMKNNLQIDICIINFKFSTIKAHKKSNTFNLIESNTVEV